MGLRDNVIDLGFRVFEATRLHRAAAPWARGLGAILMFHRVRDRQAGVYAPNRGLEITPTYLDAVLTFVRAKGYAIVTLDEAVRRLASPGKQDQFVALTFDDGTRDTAQVALPVLEKHRAPFTTFITTGFADRSARMWWLELEEAIGVMDDVVVSIDNTLVSLPARTPEEKSDAFATVYRHLRSLDEPELLRVCRALCDQAGIDGTAIVDEACLSWRGVVALSEHPLVTIGAHTRTHPRLARLSRADMREEIEASREMLAARIGRRIEHLAYPVGDPTAAGSREFAAAGELGFASAVTTRPGMLFPGHAEHVTALPRLSVNGGHQTLAALDVLLSGAPFLLMNKGRRLSVA